MSSRTIALIVVSVLISATAQICLKFGMSSASVKGALSDGHFVPITAAIGTSPFVWLGLSLYGLGAIIWLFVLARVDVSLAYPFVSFGFIVTAAFAAFILGEPITRAMIIGTSLIIAGIVVLSRG